MTPAVVNAERCTTVALFQANGAVPANKADFAPESACLRDARGSGLYGLEIFPARDVMYVRGCCVRVASISKSILGHSAKRTGICVKDSRSRRAPMKQICTCPPLSTDQDDRGVASSPSVVGFADDSSGRSSDIGSRPHPTARLHRVRLVSRRPTTGLGSSELNM